MISVQRLSMHPPRPENCSLQFVSADVASMSPMGEWEVVGNVVIQESDVSDPYSEEYREIVRPRACAIGGEAVTIAQATGVERGRHSGSATIYSVLRPRDRVPNQPTRF